MIQQQSKKGTKRRKRFSGAIRAKQQKIATSNYAKRYREVNKEIVKNQPKTKSLSWTSINLSGFKYNSKINYSND